MKILPNKESTTLLYDCNEIMIILTKTIKVMKHMMYTI
jgi:hypothetical protein